MVLAAFLLPPRAHFFQRVDDHRRVTKLVPRQVVVEPCPDVEVVSLLGVGGHVGAVHQVGGERDLHGVGGHVGSQVCP